jgi:hypothetical protein
MHMDSIVSRVVLPGVGPVCAECLSRGHLPALRLSPREVYSFGLAEHQRPLDCDVDAAHALIAARPRRALRLDPAWLETWLLERTSVTAEHLDHIPADKLDEPAIVVEGMACAPGAVTQPFPILIDGTHRAARKLRDGRDGCAYLLTEEEHCSICTYRVDGQVVEEATFSAPGVPVREATFSSAAPGNGIA